MYASASVAMVATRSWLGTIAVRLHPNLLQMPVGTT